MKPWIRLALKEFWLPFRYLKSGCPGGRDFVWLTVFICLLLTLLLLLIASREGMLNRFVDVLLGNLPGYGVPISISNNMLGKKGINGFDTAVLNDLKGLNSRIPGMQVFPRRNLEAALKPLVALPAEGIWQNSQNGNKFGPDFDGWAVYPNDPMWNDGTSKPLPLEIVMSRTLYVEYFHYGLYRKAMRAALPDELFKKIPVAFVITNRVIARLKSEQVPKNLLEKLQGKAYASEKQLSDDLKKIEPAEWKKYADVIATHAAAPSVHPDDSTPFDTIWLQIKVGIVRELHPFKVRWVERFPVIDKVAYVFPLSTYHALKATIDFPELRYFPEGGGAISERFQQITLTPLKNQAPEDFEKTCQALADKFTGRFSPYRGGMLLDLPSPLATFWVDAHLRQYGFSLQPENTPQRDASYKSANTVNSDSITFADGKISLPCGRLPNEYLTEQDIAACTGEMNQAVALDITAKGNGFRYALAYVPDRRLLSLAVEELKQVSDHAVMINSAYQDALSRFGFLSEMLAAMELPYTIFLFLFLLAFLGIQLATLIGHHRHRYGVLLAKGMEWWQIYAMLWLQIVLATTVAMSAAFAVISTARVFLRLLLGPIAKRYAATLSMADLNLLPLSAVEFWTASFGVLLLSWTIATLLLYALPLRHHTHPASLL